MLFYFQLVFYWSCDKKIILEKIKYIKYTYYALLIKQFCHFDRYINRNIVNTLCIQTNNIFYLTLQPEVTFIL